jgi:protein-disulfide isomerase
MRLMRIVVVIISIIVSVVACTSVKVVRYETAPQAEEDKSSTFDFAGMSDEQKEVARGIIDEIIPLVKAGKSEGEIIKILQKKEKKIVTRYRVEVAGSPSRGPEDAKVTIIEFSDFQCPFSNRVQPTIEKILDKYPQEVRHVFKQHPLNIHKDAQLAAEASLAAGGQGGFWDMHDIIFDNSQNIKEENLLEYALEIGLDVEQFKNDLKDRVFQAQVESEIQEANELGATATPVFFINGRYLSGAKQLGSFVNVIDEELSGKQIPSKWSNNLKEGRKKRHEKKEIPNKIYEIPVGESFWKGSKDAPVTVVMFQDFQCPFSRRSQTTINKLIRKYPEKVKVVFKNFPLGFHKEAVIAAEAAMAAGSQGKFWEMHDMNFANQKQLKIENLRANARQLGIDMNQFNDNMKTRQFKKIINEDIEIAKEVGVRGTPTFFVNGRKLVGAKPLTEFEKIIDVIMNEN